MKAVSKVAVLIGSTRPVRIAPQVARFVSESIDKNPGSAKTKEMQAKPSLNVEIIDLKDYALPIFDEPVIPNRITSPSGYTQEHTRVWAKTIASYDAFVFVSSQRNWGIPAELKNSIDYLFNEWKGKPAMIVTYGGHGGVQAGQQLNTILGAMGMRMADNIVSMTFPGADFREKAFRGEDIGLDAVSGTGPWQEHCQQIADVFWDDLAEKLSVAS